MTTFLVIVTTLAVCCLALAGLFHLALLRSLKAPRIAHDVLPETLGMTTASTTEVLLNTAHGKRLFAWLILPDPPRQGRTPAVLVMHGWGSNASEMLEVAPYLQRAGYAVLLMDARCHGNSDGERFTSMPRFAEDIATGLQFLRQHEVIDSRQLSLMGHSVGAAAALLQASRDPTPNAVVSLSAFAHPREIMQRWMAERHLPYPIIGQAILAHVQAVIGYRFDEIAPVHTIRVVSCPVLIVHGQSDTVAPFSDAERLVAANTRARLLAVEGGHDLRGALAPHAQAILAFLDGVGLETAGGTRPKQMTGTQPL